MIHSKNYFNLVQDLLNKPELIEQLEPENQLLLKQVADSIYHEVAVDSRAWIGVDLDGTLAHYNGWKGDDEIGEPVTLMKKRVLSWVEHGRRVKIMTARADRLSSIQTIHAWLERHGIPKLEVTNIKDFQMVELWDDRAVRILPNTGQRCCDH